MSFRTLRCEIWDGKRFEGPLKRGHSIQTVLLTFSFFEYISSRPSRDVCLLYYLPTSMLFSLPCEGVFPLWYVRIGVSWKKHDIHCGSCKFMGAITQYSFSVQNKAVLSDGQLLVGSFLFQHLKAKFTCQHLWSIQWLSLNNSVKHNVPWMLY